MAQSVQHRHIKASPYHWPHNANFGPGTSALVVIDMQRDFCEHGGYLDTQGYDISLVREIMPKIKKLLSVFRAAKFPIYHTREGHRPDLSTLSSRELFRSRNNPSGLGIGDSGPLGRLLVRGEPGHDTVRELYPVLGEVVIDKPGRSAFAHTDFELLLRNRGIVNLVICGVTTDVCVSSTQREANDRGYDCMVLEDCTAASEPTLHQSSLGSITMEGGIFGAVGNSQDVIEAISSS